MNLQELGVLLKQERERRGLTVRDVMDSTKISRRNLNALEDGEVKLLPHPVYLKGYVRNYARLVGLDAEPLVLVVDEQWDGDSAYAAQKPTPAVSAAAPSALSVLASAQGEITPPRLSSPDASESERVEAAEPEPAGQASTAEDEQQCRPAKPVELSPKPRKRLWPWILLLLLICGGAGIAYQCQRIQAEDTQAPPLAAPAANATDVNATAANATDAAEADARDEAAELANATAALPEPLAAPAPAAPVAAPAPVQAAAPAQTAEVRTPGMQELVVVAKPGEICWVEVSEGQRRKTFTIRDGDSRRFEFSNVAKVRLGNAGGVSFRLNGSFYPYEGQRGQTATVEIGAH